SPASPTALWAADPDPDSFRPQNQRSRTQNPKQTRPQPPVERGWADKADSRPPLRGPGGWGGNWYVWHAPDGLRARAATGLGCMQAGTEKLGVIEASYASAIIGVLSPVSSHCCFSGSIRPWLVMSHNMPMINTNDTASKLAWFKSRSQLRGGLLKSRASPGQITPGPSARSVAPWARR